MNPHHPQFPLLLSPLQIGRVTLRNRLVSTGHGTRLVENYEIGDRLLAYHEARARGGAGLIITEAAMVQRQAAASTSHLVVAQDSVIPSLRRLADVCHSHDCMLFGQVFHLGLEQNITLDGHRAAALGPSAAPSERYHTSGREMSVSEISALVADFGNGALRMKKAGFDGIEVAASHGYLIAQFLAPEINRRTDNYGGTRRNRLRLLTEIIADIRAKVGPDMPVGVRISGDELASDGLDADEVRSICKDLDADRLVDYFNVTSGSSRQSGSAIHIVPPMSTSNALTAPFASEIRKDVSVPVMAVGRINHAPLAEEVLRTGQADFCGMTRAMITDPEMPNKLLAGQAGDVRVCIGCNQACIDRMHRGFGVSCIQHPETGRELEFGALKPTGQPKRVFVVGGGPGGLKAAAVAAARGHDVTLFERDTHLGGQVRMAQLLPRRAEFGGLTGNLERDARMAGADIRLGQNVDRTYIEGASPDVVVLATGAAVFRPDIEGAEEAHVVDAWEVLEGRANVGSRAVIADWRCDWIGMGLAEKLAREGCAVRLASTGHVAGEMIPRYMRDLWLGELHKLGVTMVPMARLFGADNDTAYFQHITSGEAIICEDMDTLVLSQGHVSNTSLETTLAGWGGEIHVIGDCLAPRTAEEAVFEGLKTGCAI